MYKDQISRRNFLYKTMQWTAVGGVAGVLAGCGGDDGGADSGTAEPTTTACVSPDSLSPSENSLRQSVNYTEKSENPETVCGQCAYFHADGATGCGTCDILRGIVNESGHCASWAQRA